MTHQQIGARGEALAADFLEEQGWRVMERNYRFERAEIDLVCFEPAADTAHGGEIVFVEVKTRNSTSFGEPEEHIDDRKKRQLFKVAEAWLHERRMEGSPVRFDVISILRPGRSDEKINHIEGAFWRL